MSMSIGWSPRSPISRQGRPTARAVANTLPLTKNTPLANTDGDEIARCALDDWVAAGHAEPARLDSLRRLLAVRDKPDLD